MARNVRHLSSEAIMVVLNNFDINVQQFSQHWRLEKTGIYHLHLYSTPESMIVQARRFQQGEGSSKL